MEEQVGCTPQQAVFTCPKVRGWVLAGCGYNDSGWMGLVGL